MAENAEEMKRTLEIKRAVETRLRVEAYQKMVEGHPRFRTGYIEEPEIHFKWYRDLTNFPYLIFRNRELPNAYNIVCAGGDNHTRYVFRLEPAGQGFQAGFLPEGDFDDESYLRVLEWQDVVDSIEGVMGVFDLDLSQKEATIARLHALTSQKQVWTFERREECIALLSADNARRRLQAFPGAPPDSILLKQEREIKKMCEVQMIDIRADRLVEGLEEAILMADRTPVTRQAEVLQAFLMEFSKLKDEMRLSDFVEVRSLADNQNVRTAAAPAAPPEMPEEDAQLLAALTMSLGAPAP